MNSQGKATISCGDIIELIPGHHVYKYEVLGGGKNVPLVHSGNRYSGNEASSRNSEVFSFLLESVGGWIITMLIMCSFHFMLEIDYVLCFVDSGK